MKLVDIINKINSRMPDTVKILNGRLFTKIPNSLIYGKVYRNARKFLEETQHYTKEQIEEMQFLKLKKIVSECYNRSPFYRRFYKEHGFSPGMLKDLSDINKIPPIDKSIVRKEIKNIAIPLSFKYFVSMSRTGGTCTSPMVFPEILEAKIWERAFIDRFYSWHNLKDTDPKISFKGGHAGPKVAWYYSPFLKSTVFTFWDIFEERIKTYSEIIQKIKPKAIVASYPSLVYAFARAINKGLIPKLESIKIIFCSSETLFPYQIKEIEAAFGIKPIDYYGQNERVSLIQQCVNRQYHIIPEYGITEILDENNRPITNGVGEIVGTGFLNRAFPLIRYKTGDFAVINLNKTCSCGLSYTCIEKIEGRSGDFLKTDNGMAFSPTVIESTVDNFKHFKDIQFIQNSINQVDILLCPDNGYDMTDGENLVRDLTYRTKNRIKFRLKIVEKIPRPKNSKKRLIISKIE